MPEASLVELDGGHACILENPPQFIAALASHVESAVAS
jgi:pimeloyl-ACP methyl ester carboxylesterase